MQTKKFSLQDFAGGTLLSREEMKNVLGGQAASSGGGSCCAHFSGGNGYNYYTCGLSKSDAQSTADEYAENYGDGHWCCDSCPQSVIAPQ